MSASTQELTTAPEKKRKKKRFSLLTRRDLIVLGLLLGVPAAIHIFFVWVPALLSIVLSFARWNGIGQ